MVTQSFIYWFTRLDHLHRLLGSVSNLAVLVIVVCALLTGGCFIGKKISIDDNSVCEAFSETLAVSLKTLLFATMAMLTVGVVQTFVPTTKEMAAIYVVPRLANNADVREIGSEMTSLAKEWLEELHPSKMAEKSKTVEKTR